MSEVTAAIPSAASVQPCSAHRSRARVDRVERAAPARGADVAAVLAADLEERVADLPERAHPHGVHERVEDVAAAGRRRLQRRDRGRRLLAVAGVEVGEPVELRLLLGLGGPRELRRPGRRRVASGARNVLTPTIGRLPSCFLCSYSIDSSWIRPRW